MPELHYGAYRFFIVSWLTLTLAACGGGASSSGGGTTTPPPPQEFLFGAGDNTVYAYTLNTETGVPNQTSLIAGNQGGFGIAANPAVTFLYTDDLTNGGIDAFAVSSTGVLTTVSGSPFPMPSDWSVPQVDNLAIDPAGKFLYTTDPASNVVVGFTIGATGALAPLPGSPFPAGASPQQVAITPSGEFLYASDGNDPEGGISAYTIDSSTGNLTALAGSPFATASSGQPDGLSIDPSGNFLYAALTFNNSIAAFTINSNTGVLTPVAGSPFLTTPNGFPIIFSLAISPNGKFLYAQGDLDGNIYGFTIDPGTGALTAMTGSPFFADYTFMNNLVIDPSSNFLYIGASTLPSFFYLAIDPTTGALTPTANVSYAYIRSFAGVKAP